MGEVIFMPVTKYCPDCDKNVTVEDEEEYCPDCGGLLEEVEGEEEEDWEKEEGGWEE